LLATATGLLGIALVMAGCGSGGDSSTASISKAEFVKAADATCEKAENRIQADYAVFLKEHEKVTSPTKAEYDELADKVFVSNVEEEIAELRALGIPDGDGEKVEDFIDARQESIQIAEENPKMLLTEGAKVTAKSAQIAQEYGLKSCGNA
jgi:hypothetical protein